MKQHSLTQPLLLDMTKVMVHCFELVSEMHSVGSPGEIHQEGLLVLTCILILSFDNLKIIAVLVSLFFFFNTYYIFISSYLNINSMYWEIIHSLDISF